jgi:hypothetical protein
MLCRSSSLSPFRRGLLVLLTSAVITLSTQTFAGSSRKSSEPLHLHPENPHYLVFQGRPAVLVASTEHYGAIMNEAWSDEDRLAYLDELQRKGLNLTRIFSGVYRERFNHIALNPFIPMPPNTLGPIPGEYRAPWARSKTPGYADGGNKFDLTQWDPVYFERLKRFVSEAAKRGIAVEYTIFHNFFGDLPGGPWSLSPLNAANNVNGVGKVDFIKANTLDNDGLLPFQEALARKVVTELNAFDNVYYEIIGEPNIAGVGDVYVPWENHIIDTIVKAERGLPQRHLIAVNVAVGHRKITAPNPNVSIFSFHFTWDDPFRQEPDTVRTNYGLNRVISYDETVFFGTTDTPYRAQGWSFIFAGGGIFDNADYSFTPSDPKGTERAQELIYPRKYQKMFNGMGGSPTIRDQLGFLLRFVSALPFAKMVSADDVVTDGPALGTTRILAKRGEVYAAYLNAHGGAKRGDGANWTYPAIEAHTDSVTLKIPPGHYFVRWFDPVTGEMTQRGDHKVSADGALRLESPSFTDDAVLLVTQPGKLDPLVPYYAGK